MSPRENDIECAREMWGEFCAHAIKRCQKNPPFDELPDDIREGVIEESKKARIKLKERIERTLKAFKNN